VLVLGVRPGSPAAAAGIEPARLLPDGRIVPGDVIERIDDVPVPTVEALLAELERRDAGDRVGVVVRRNGREARVEVTLEAAAG
jgi:S1-C subfamily serine protease